MRQNILILLVIIFVPSVFAANHYVRDGSSGDGSDWNNAWDSLPGNLVRGDTYYIADGTYPGYTFDDSESGTQYIYIKKAIGSDHGTGVGWQNGYGDGVAVLGSIAIITSYIDIDGQTGGGPGSWEENFGFKFMMGNCGGTSHCVRSDMRSRSGAASHVRIHHIDMEGCGATGQNGQSNIQLYAGTGVVRDWLFEYVWAHDVTITNVHTARVGEITIQYSKMGIRHPSAGGHGEIMSINDAGIDSGWVLRNNIFYDFFGTGYIVIKSGRQSGFDIYGNVFYASAPRYMVSNGVISDTTSTCVGPGEENDGTFDVKVYHNTFINIPRLSGTPAIVVGMSCLSQGNEFKNNLLIDVGPPGGAAGVEVRSHNLYNSQASANENNGQYYSGNMQTLFTNPSSHDYSLRIPTDPGDTVSLSNVDMNGNQRGADGVWDRGAFEYTGNSLCNNDECDSGECSSCPGDCTLSECHNNGQCESGFDDGSENCQTDPADCGCGIDICCSGTCQTPACSANSDCSDSSVCTNDVCSNPGTCTSSCTNPQITECLMTSDGCCPTGCTENTDADCSAPLTGLCEDMLALYHFDGDADDASGIGNDGTVNGATFTASGKFGGAYSFDGSNDHIAADNVDDMITDYPLTISAWVRTTSDTWGSVASLADSSSETSYVDIHIQPGGTPLAIVRTDSSFDAALSSETINDGTWHNIVAVYTSSNQRDFFVDGELKASNTVNKPFPALNNFNIGRLGRLSDTNYFLGEIDDVAVWNRALSAGEIESIYDSSSIQCECIQMTLAELIAVIDEWKAGTKNLNEVMQSIVEWKNGC